MQDLDREKERHRVNENGLMLGIETANNRNELQCLC
jgi:hypothetical protein